MTLEADHADVGALRDEAASSVGTVALRHVVINLFNLIILLPLAWVLHPVGQVAARRGAR